MRPSPPLSRQVVPLVQTVCCFVRLCTPCVCFVALSFGGSLFRRPLSSSSADDIFDVDVGGANLRSLDRSAYVTYTVQLCASIRASRMRLLPAVMIGVER